MSKWIMIWWSMVSMGHGQVEFGSQELCRAAAQAIKETDKGSMGVNVRAVCIEVR